MAANASINRPASGGGNGRRVGGLVGQNLAGVSIDYNYAASTVAGGGGGVQRACLAVDNNQTDSYYSSDICTETGGIGTAKTTAELQEPAGYTAGSIYADWNADVDGVGGGDDPWDIRLGHLPVLKYGGFDVDRQRPLLASVANQISSVMVTPGVLANSTITLNGQAVSSGSGVMCP